MGNFDLLGGTHLVVLLRTSLQVERNCSSRPAQRFRAQAWDTMCDAQHLDLCKLGRVLAVRLTPLSGATAQRVALSLFDFFFGAMQGVPTALVQPCASLLWRAPTWQSFFTVSTLLRSASWLVPAWTQNTTTSPYLVGKRGSGALHKWATRDGETVRLPQQTLDSSGRRLLTPKEMLEHWKAKWQERRQQHRGNFGELKSAVCRLRCEIRAGLTDSGLLGCIHQESLDGARFGESSTAGVCSPSRFFRRRVSVS